jgi:hypothetical protein
MFQLLLINFILLVFVLLFNYNFVGYVLLAVPFSNSNEVSNKRLVIKKHEVLGIGPNSNLFKKYKESLVKLSQVQ